VLEMLRLPRLAFGLSACVLSCACSEGNDAMGDREQPTNVAPSPNPPDVAPPANTPSAVSPSASNPPAAAGSGLSGQWDVIFSSPTGRTKTIQVTMSPTLLELTGDIDDALVITNGGTFDVALEDDKVEGTRTANPPLELGVMPLPLDGILRFTDGESPEKSCDSTLTANGFSFVCGSDVGGGFNNSRTTATKSKSLVSDFGDVGGEWLVTSGNVTCSAKLETSTIVVTCQGGGKANGTMTITLDGDRVTGITSGGAEFTAQRR
jgi:hypothetical protein